MDTKNDKEEIVVKGVKPEDKSVTNKVPLQKNNPKQSSIGKSLRQMVQPEAIMLIPEVLARRYNAVPITISGNTLEVAMSNPSDILTLEAFSIQSGMRIKPVIAPARDIRDAIDFNYKAYGEIERQISSYFSEYIERIRQNGL